MYYLQEELARVHRNELMDQARHARHGRRLAMARRQSRRAERAALQARLSNAL